MIWTFPLSLDHIIDNVPREATGCWVIGVLMPKIDNSTRYFLMIEKRQLHLLSPTIRHRNEVKNDNCICLVGQFDTDILESVITQYP
jgi:hypothetical protein